MRINPTIIRPTTTATRRVLLTASLLVFILGIPLFLFAGNNDDFFAWTVNPPLTAAFMGAAFTSAGVLELLAARESQWARARVAVPAVLVFTALTLGITLYHIDRFHTSEPRAWIWIAVYAVFPPLLALAWIGQRRVPGGDPPTLVRPSYGARGALAAQGVVMFAVGVALVIVPTEIAPYWPWELSALTGRAIGAWLVGLGIAAAHAAWENDLGRIEHLTLSSIVFAALQFVALARYPDNVDWGSFSAWFYVVFLASILFVGVLDLAATRQSARIPETA